jgi:hypothetical protein
LYEEQARAAEAIAQNKPYVTPFARLGIKGQELEKYREQIWDAITKLLFAERKLREELGERETEEENKTAKEYYDELIASIKEINKIGAEMPADLVDENKKIGKAVEDTMEAMIKAGMVETSWYKKLKDEYGKYLQFLLKGDDSAAKSLLEENKAFEEGMRLWDQEQDRKQKLVEEGVLAENQAYEEGLREWDRLQTEKTKLAAEALKQENEEYKAGLREWDKLQDEILEKQRAKWVAYMETAVEAMSAIGVAILQIAAGAEDGWKRLAQAVTGAIATILEALAHEYIVKAAAALIPAIGEFNPAAAAGYFKAALFAQTAAGIVRALAMGEGGIVTKPTLALLGESGREAVVPLDRYGGGGGLVIHYHVRGSLVSEAQLLGLMQRGAGRRGRGY